MIASVSPEASGQLRSGRVLELDGLRAFAILPVMIYHCYPENKGWITLAGQAGWIGVDLFFVLSGYLITSIVLNTLATRIFIATSSSAGRFGSFALLFVPCALYGIGLLDRRRGSRCNEKVG